MEWTPLFFDSTCSVFDDTNSNGVQQGYPLLQLLETPVLDMLNQPFGMMLTASTPELDVDASVFNPIFSSSFSFSPSSFSFFSSDPIQIVRRTPTSDFTDDALFDQLTAFNTMADTADVVDGISPKEVAPDSPISSGCSSVASTPSANSVPWSTSAFVDEESDKDEDNDIDDYVPTTAARRSLKPKPYDGNTKMTRNDKQNRSYPVLPVSPPQTVPKSRTVSRASKTLTDVGMQVRPRTSRLPAPRALYSRLTYSPPAGELPMSPAAIEVIEDFTRGPLASESAADHRQRIVEQIEVLIIEHIKSIGSKIRLEADSKSRPGDYLARMKGCLRNAAMGLYLVENLPKTTPIDAHLLRSILVCVPPPSTRPAAKRVDAMLSAVQTMIGVAPASRETLEKYWINQLNQIDRNFMRNNAQSWPGRWEKLGL